MIEPVRVFPKNILHFLNAGITRREVHHELSLHFQWLGARVKHFVGEGPRPELDRLRQERRRGGDEALHFLRRRRFLGQVRDQSPSETSFARRNKLSRVFLSS